MRDFGHEVSIRIFTDSTAAQGIAQRVGLGKTRHIAVHLLWLQQHMRNKVFDLCKVKGTENPADLFTKHVSKDWNNECLHLWNGEHRVGRSEVAPQSIYA